MKCGSELAARIDLTIGLMGDGGQAAIRILGA